MSTAATFRHTLAAAFALLMMAAPALARDKVKITGVRVGFPPGTDSQAPHVSKFATWAPVFVDLEITGDITEPAEILIEAPDPDDFTTTLSVPAQLTSAKPGTTLAGGEYGPLGYLRPSGGSGEITVTVRTTSGTPLSEPFRLRSLRPREPLTYLVLSTGGKPAGFELPKATSAGADPGSLRGGRIELASITKASELPDQWFGYSAADLVVVCTGSASEDFLKKLFGPPGIADQRKQDAFLEWVRRGGRVVVSLGANAQLARELPALQALIPYSLKPDSPAREVKQAAAVQTTAINGALVAKGGPFLMANLIPQPSKSSRVLISANRSPNDKEKDTLAAQWAFGLGRVTVIGFDLDRAPFADFAQRPEFWDWVLRECGSARASAGGDGKPRPPGILTEDEDEAAVAIRTHNDTFDGVPVISFGWVAMLIVLYILLIGPIEYFFLKRVLGRLELTWITFPIIVLTVSVLAYVSATAVKGREMKVNKVDVVDIDLASDRIYGTTWFTIFSPRTDTYSISVTPGDGWTANTQTSGTVVEWIGAPRGGRGSLVRRRYSVHSDGATIADGLENVPIQVWSTKAFSANWSAQLNSLSGSKPLVDSTLEHPAGDRTKVVGSFTHHLPVPALVDCVAFYAGHAYPLPGEVIVNGARVRLVLDQPVPATQWLQTKGQLDELLRRVQMFAERSGQKGAQKTQQQPLFTGPLPMWGVLFHEAALRKDEGVIPRNASLRRLDQTWRLSPDNREEVIIVGRVAPPLGSAEDVLSGPNSPSTLWIKALPASGEARPKITGTARQETWVRFYLPVK
ncbi:MAG: hypothetical protein L0241_19330 [Planctomycetia bacterium]|nr:hypothetical protein [Planctomycetia bacterium]